MSIRKEYHQHFKKRGFKLKEKIGLGLSGNTIKGFQEYIKKHAPLPLDVVLKISTQILDTLSFVHENKIIHRDIKPSKRI